MNSRQDGGLPSQHGGRGVAAGFWGDCLMFTVGATITIAIATLDIISDWLMYKTFLNIDLPGKVEQVTSRSNQNVSDDLVWRLDDFYLNMPTILEGILILASINYCAYFIWFCYMFKAERHHLKNKWDGLPFKGTLMEKYGSEIFLCLHVLFEDFPVAGLLFAVQIAVSCQVLFHLDNAIYLLALSVTLISILWKFVCLIWNCGCFGQRDEYHTGCAVSILRCLSLLFIVCAFIFSVWNIILLRGHTGSRYHGNTLRNFIMDKIGVDRWTENDKIIITQSEHLDDLIHTLQNQERMHKYVINVVPLKQILQQNGDRINFKIPCQSPTGNSSLTSFFQPQHQTGTLYSNCTSVFTFVASTETMEIQYDYAYYFYNENKECISGKFQRQLPLPERLVDNLQTASLETGMKRDNAVKSGLTTPSSVTTPQIASSSRSQYANVSLPYNNVYHTVMLLSHSWSSTIFRCDYILIHNTTLIPDTFCQ